MASVQLYLEIFFLLSAAAVLAQAQLSINYPPYPEANVEFGFSWSGGVPPYTASVLTADLSGVQYKYTGSDASTTWNFPLAPGAQVVFQVVDSENNAQTSPRVSIIPQLTLNSPQSASEGSQVSFTWSGGLSPYTGYVLTPDLTAYYFKYSGNDTTAAWTVGLPSGVPPSVVFEVVDSQNVKVNSGNVTISGANGAGSTYTAIPLGTQAAPTSTVATQSLPSTIPTHNTTTKPMNKTNVGAIVGGVVGGIMALLIGIAIAFFCGWRRRGHLFQTESQLPLGSTYASSTAPDSTITRSPTIVSHDPNFSYLGSPSDRVSPVGHDIAFAVTARNTFIYPNFRQPQSGQGAAPSIISPISPISGGYSGYDEHNDRMRQFIVGRPPPPTSSESGGTTYGMSSEGTGMWSQRPAPQFSFRTFSDSATLPSYVTPPSDAASVGDGLGILREEFDTWRRLQPPPPLYYSGRAEVDTA